MFWFVLVIFVLIVLVPEVVVQGLFTLSEDQTEAIAILCLGGIAFLIFSNRDSQLLQQLRERVRVQREVNSATRDLSTSYSYIGEMNRKLELLKSVIFESLSEEFPKGARDLNCYITIMDALRTIVKSDSFFLRFVDERTHKTVWEIKQQASQEIVVKNSDICIEPTVGVFQEKGVLVIKSSCAVNGVRGCVVIANYAENDFADDVSLIKALASQALLLFVSGKQK